MTELTLAAMRFSIASLVSVLSNVAWASGFYEVGEIDLTTTIDSNFAGASTTNTVSGMLP